MHKNGVDDDFDFSIEFIDLRNYYNNNIDNSVVQPVQSDTDKLLEARDNPSIVRMFNSINKIIGRPLAPSENIKIIINPVFMHFYNIFLFPILPSIDYI